MRRGPATSLALLLGALLAVAAPGAAGEGVVVPLRHRAAAELVPLVEASLGEESRVVADPATNSLVLFAPAAEAEALRRLVERLDRPRHSVVVRVESRTERALRSAGWRVVWSGGEALGTGRLTDSNGDVASGEDPRAPTRVLATGREDVFATSLRILDGETGRIESGRSVPITDRSLLGTTTTVVEASSGLLVSPTVVSDDRVRLELAPYAGELDERARTRTLRSATTVELSPGEIVVLGSLTDDLSRSGRGDTIRRGGGATRENTLWLISVDLD